MGNNLCRHTLYKYWIKIDGLRCLCVNVSCILSHEMDFLPEQIILLFLLVIFYSELYVEFSLRSEIFITHAATAQHRWYCFQ